MIVVLGASGNTGRTAAEILLKEGLKVRAVGRDAGKLKSLKGAEVLTGDASDAAFLKKAFDGAEAAYTLIPPNFTAPDFRAYQDKLGEALAAAVASSPGLSHVAFLSSLGAEQPSGTGPIAGLHAQEERFRRIKGKNFLFLRVGYFFENHFSTLGLIKAQGVNGGAVRGDVPIAMIATKDIGAAAAAALKAKDFSGVQTREFLGPRDLTLDETTRLLGAKIGKPDLKYVQFPYDQFEKALVGMGLSASLAAGYAEMSKAINDGRVRSVEGRKPSNSTPTRFEDFADVLAGAYKASS
jgi:uncharacterized protein YbjT (DUF2867 family)